MKKVLVILLVSAFVATFATAEGGVSWGAWGRTGVVVAQGGSATVAGTTVTNPATTVLTPGWNGGAFQIHLALNYDGPVIGFHATFNNSQADLLGGFVNLEVSSKIVPDLLTLGFGAYQEYDVYSQGIDVGSTILPDSNQNIGRLGSYYRGAQGVIASMSGKNNGWVNLTLAPKDSGFSLTVAYPVGFSAAYNVGDAFGDIFVGAKYAIPSVGTITAGTVPNNGATNYDRNVFLGFSLTAVKDLTIVVDGSVDFRVAGLNDNVAVKNDSMFKLNAGAKFNAGDFSIGLAAWLLTGIGDANVAAQTTSVIIDLAPAYNLGEVKVGLFGEISLGSTKFAGVTADSPLGWVVFPNVVFNACGLNVGVKLAGTSVTVAGVTSSTFNWSIPVAYDFSF